MKLHALTLGNIRRRRMPERKPLKVYLDNNVVSAIGKDDTPAESSALDRLLEAYYQEKVELVTSELTLQEIKKYHQDALERTLLLRIFRLLAKVPIVRWDELVGMHVYMDLYTSINAPLIQNDPLYENLLRLGIKQVDAQHVFVAAKQGCSDFLTCDGGVLSRAKAMAALCGVTALNPSGLVAREQW